MELNRQEFLKDRDQSKQENDEPNASRVDDDDNLREEDLERGLFITDNDKKPVREGVGAGGQDFGKNNNTPAANDKNNPSQNAGNTNAYFDRTEPSEEHPEDTNFKVKEQDGSTAYNGQQPDTSIQNATPKPEKPEERGNGENDRPHEEVAYQEGTADYDGSNIPGPEELPDQQKVGEPAENDDKDHIET